MDLFNQCLRSLRNACTDTEKFAALLLVTKVFKSDTLSTSIKRELFHAIGDSFLNRLLHTEVIPPGCPSHIFKSIALTVLAALCSETDKDVKSAIIDNIDVIKEIITIHPQSPEEKVMVDDALLCVNFATSDVTELKVLIKCGLLDSLIEVYLRQSYGSEKALQVFLSMLVQNPIESWTMSEESIKKLLSQLAISFYAEQTQQKFDYANLLTTVVGTHLTVKDVSNEEWIIPIQNGIYDLVTSSAFKSYRGDILKLASALTERFGVSWFGICKNDKSCKLVALLMHLVSIEIRMILENRDIEEIIEDSALLTSCYHILECFISVNNENMWELIQKQTEQLLAAVTASMDAVIMFLLAVENQWDNLDNNLRFRSLGRDLTYATIRLLCSWMAEESLSLRNEICQILPFILKVTREGLKEEPTSEELVDERPDVLRFLLAPMCHLSADDMTRKVLITQGVPILLVKYLKCKFKILMQLSNPLLEGTLATVCGILLNIVVMEGSIVATDETFFSLFKFLHHALPRLSAENQFLMLQANFAVLGLLIARHQFGKPKSNEVHFHKFLSSSVKFLWNAHEVVDTGEYVYLTLSREYKLIWNDIMELWFLGLQALVGVLSVVPWIGGFLLTSGWPQHIVQSLKVVPNENIECNVKLAYQNFLCCLMKSCPGDMQPLVDQGIVDVARLHALKELETLVNIIQAKA